MDNLEDLDPEIREYIHQLQDRVQWLEQELEESERENIRQHQENQQTSSDNSDIVEEAIRGYEELTL
jgi:uncharacterized protein YaaN involved in tellurite resistance